MPNGSDIEQIQLFFRLSRDWFFKAIEFKHSIDLAVGFAQERTRRFLFFLRAGRAADRCGREVPVLRLRLLP